MTNLTPPEGTPAMYLCQWCAENPVPEPALCPQCQQEPDALEFKAAHDAQCPCMTVPVYRPAGGLQNGESQ